LEAGVDKAITDERQRKEALLSTALNLEKEASRMESLCLLIRIVAEHRQELFATIGDA
jgi:hypothetical protein